MTDTVSSTADLHGRMPSPASRRSRKRRRPDLLNLYLYGAMFIMASIVLVPLITTALGGFKTLGELRTNPFGLPQQWIWSNY
jgi:raffinose/stachyose/melibiose transport system permease protein